LVRLCWIITARWRKLADWSFLFCHWRNFPVLFMSNFRAAALGPSICTRIHMEERCRKSSRAGEVTGHSTDRPAEASRLCLMCSKSEETETTWMKRIVTGFLS
ncbi:unnamed protein product, partial [Ectocarpus fasciculatus]